MIKVLIISPHFPPINAADMQRVRLLLPHLDAVGVKAEVLAVEAGQVAAPKDAWLEAGLPDDVPVHRVRALGLKWTRLPSLGILSFRALWALRKKGNRLLSRKGEKGKESIEFDLVYFSTTQFALHVLGPYWKKKFGVPFVMDFQDPWVNDYYREHPEIRPPGGRLKYDLASAMSRRQEPKVLRECSGITSVSAAYPDQLQQRYDWLRVEDFTLRVTDLLREVEELEGKETGESIGYLSYSDDEKLKRRKLLPSVVMPFPGDAWDLERVKDSKIGQSVFDPEDGKEHWVYVGVCGPTMAKAIRGLFLALSGQTFRKKSLRLHFIGTSYAAAGTGDKTVVPLAEEFGLQNLVEEYTDRIPYSEALRCLLDADGLLVLGSDDPGYTASKIYPYLLAEKPMLAIFHEQSSVVSLIEKVGGAKVVAFQSGESVESLASRIEQEGWDAQGNLFSVSFDEEAFRPHTAAAQAQTIAEFFGQVLHG